MVTIYQVTHVKVMRTKTDTLFVCIDLYSVCILLLTPTVEKLYLSSVQNTVLKAIRVK